MSCLSRISPLRPSLRAWLGVALLALALPDAAFTPEQRATQVKLAEASIGAYCKPAAAAVATQP